jgi:hypothetical protein
LLREARDDQAALPRNHRQRLAVERDHAWRVSEVAAVDRELLRLCIKRRCTDVQMVRRRRLFLRGRRRRERCHAE